MFFSGMPRPQLQRFHDLALVDQRGQDDGAQLRVLIGDFAECFQPGHVGHQQVQQQDVGAQLGDRINRLAAIGNLGNNLITCFRSEKVAKNITNDGIIVGQDNSYDLCGFALRVVDKCNSPKKLPPHIDQGHRYQAAADGSRRRLRPNRLRPLGEVYNLGRIQPRRQARDLGAGDALRDPENAVNRGLQSTGPALDAIPADIRNRRPLLMAGFLRPPRKLTPHTESDTNWFWRFEHSRRLFFSEFATLKHVSALLPGPQLP